MIRPVIIAVGDHFSHAQSGTHDTHWLCKSREPSESIRTLSTCCPLHYVHAPPSHSHIQRSLCRPFSTPVSRFSSAASRIVHSRSVARASARLCDGPRDGFKNYDSPHHACRAIHTRVPSMGCRNHQTDSHHQVWRALAVVLAVACTSMLPGGVQPRQHPRARPQSPAVANVKCPPLKQEIRARAWPRAAC